MERKLEFIDGLGSARTMVNAPDIFAVIPKDMNMMIDDESTTKAEDWATPAGSVPHGTMGKHSISIDLTEGKEPHGD